MSRLSIFVLGAVLALGPGLVMGQDNSNRTNPNNNTTNAPVTSQSQDQTTSGQSTMPPATGQATSQPQQGNQTTSGQSTVGSQTQTMPATNGRATTPQQQDSVTSGQGTTDQTQATTPAPVGGDYGANGNSTGEANRSMPNTGLGWLAMLLEGGILGSAGLTLRRVLACS